MKNHVTSLTVYDGYTIDVRNYHLDMEVAHRVLLSRKQHHYTCAIKKENEQVVLTEHVITCPSCGFRQSSTPRFFGERIPKLSKPDIDRWIYGQKGLWDDDDFLQLHRLVIPKRFECPICGATNELGCNKAGVKVETDKRKIKVHCRWVSNGNLLSESLELNFHRGRAILTQYRIWEQKETIRDVTECPQIFRDSHIYHLLEGNVRVRKLLYRRLRDAWEQNLPYELEQMRPETFIMLIRFLRYPVSFFEAIPWRDHGGCKVSPHFAAIAQKLHDGKNLQAILTTLRPLNDFRSIRRMLLERPGFVFYYQEATALLEIMGNDPATFCDFLRGRHGFWLLSQLAAYPFIIEFLRDYIQVKGVDALIQQLNRSAGMVRYYALEYGCMEGTRRKEEQRHWEYDKMEFWPGPGFSTMLSLGDACSDGQVGKYRFRYMRSTYDLQECGRLMNNPLLGLQTEGTVVLISQGNGKPLGIAQIHRKLIVAAEGKKGPLFGEPRRALEIWAKEQGLHFDEDDTDDEYYF